MGFAGRDIISTRDFSKDDLALIVQTAVDIKKAMLSGNRKYAELLKEVKVITAFTEDSTRTFYSTRTAAAQLGASDIDGFASGTGTSLKKRESWHDTLRMLTGYGADVVVMRHHLDGAARWSQEVAKSAQEDDAEKLSSFRNAFSIDETLSVRRTIIANGGDGTNQHPTQFMLDYFTIRELRGDWESLDLGCFNDLKYGRTTHSIMVAAARGLLGDVRLHLAFPEGFGPSKHYFDELTAAGIEYTIYDSLEEGLPHCDIAYFTRFQRGRFRDPSEEKRIGKQWSLSAEKLSKMALREGLRIMHPLPIDKELGEIRPCVHKTEQAYYFQQAANGVFVRMAMLGLITGKIKDPRGEDGQPDVQVTDIDPFTVLTLGADTVEEKNRRSGYIEEDGIVIDHIPQYKGERLTGFLGWRGKGLGLVFTESVVGTKADSVPKDVIKLHSGYEPTDDEYARIRLIAPEAVVTVVRNGRKVEKRKPNLPPIVESQIKCSNEGVKPDSGCISVNPKHKEGVPSRFVVEKESPLEARCHWCETTTDLETIYREKRLIYRDEEY